MPDLPPTIQPVILGGDVGAYSLARAFHEAYGVRSIVISGTSTGLMRRSRILTHLSEPRIDDDAAVVDRLLTIARNSAGRRLIAVASTDWLVETLVGAAATLRAAGYVVPYVDAPLLARMTDKERFGALCRELDIPHPTTVVCQVPDFTGHLDTRGLRFPVIAKASSSALMHDVTYDGKQKVHTVQTPEELAALLTRVREAGYPGAMIIQDYIPGDDSGMRILTCYSDQAGRVRFSGFGQVLLEEHAPGALGNPAGIITEPNPAVAAQAARLLEQVGWTGFANFDLKHDPRTGDDVFFELNPRLGRSNFYLTAAGANPIRFYVTELLQGQDPDPRTVLDASKVDEAGNWLPEHLYTVLPGLLLRRYLFDRPLRRRACRLLLTGRASKPLSYLRETDPRRWAYIAVSQVNHFRKFGRFYPRAAARRHWAEGRWAEGRRAVGR
ncbi:MAG: carboxylate--amine ligase [Promicromonosporaceae bacterium]|nr:carboxylate--amine ligase [Promicromonosporaceae bacterium]